MKNWYIDKLEMKTNMNESYIENLPYENRCQKEKNPSRYGCN